MKFHLKDLEVFLEVAKVKSLTKAAESLYVSQPSLTKTIQKLERELDVVLFDRSNKQLRLTDAGFIVFEKSRDILANVKSMSVSLNELSDVVTGELCIGIPQIIGTLFFPRIAQHFKKQFPGVTLFIKEEGA